LYAEGDDNLGKLYPAIVDPTFVSSFFLSSAVSPDCGRIQNPVVIGKAYPLMYVCARITQQKQELATLGVLLKGSLFWV
jgi:hypothetical protein